MFTKERVRGRARVAYARAGQRLEEALKSSGPRRTGRMVEQSRVYPRGEYRLAVIVGTDYASYVRGGTRAHEIRPRTKRALAFFWPKVGTDVIFARVHHPGTKPNTWYDDALAEFPRMVEAELGRLP